MGELLSKPDVWEQARENVRAMNHCSGHVLKRDLIRAKLKCEVCGGTINDYDNIRILSKLMDIRGSREWEKAVLTYSKGDDGGAA